MCSNTNNYKIDMNRIMDSMEKMNGTTMSKAGKSTNGATDGATDRANDRKFHTGNISYNQMMSHPFLFIQNHKKDYTKLANTMLKGIACPDLLAKVFFSKDNIDIVQYRLKQYVSRETFKQTGISYVIQPQDDTKILSAMRYYFLENAKHLPYNIREQIDELDDIIIAEIGPNVTTELLAHVGYLEHINNPIQTMDRPQNLSSRGTKTLPSFTTRF